MSTVIQICRKNKLLNASKCLLNLVLIKKLLLQTLIILLIKAHLNLSYRRLKKELILSLSKVFKVLKNIAIIQFSIPFYLLRQMEMWLFLLKP